MQLLSNEIENYIERSSSIRRMFEAGIELKKQYGDDNVYDFSLGNPDLPPPASVISALHKTADELSAPFALGYMPNAGYPDAREKLAAYLADEQQSPVTADHVVLTCGAAGAINAFLRAILAPGDEVVCPAPYFVEYGFYVSNFGGTLTPVKSKPLSFELDLAGIDAAINEKTRAVIINSPNNPTGVVYEKTELKALAQILAKHTERYGRPVYLISDEPYRFLTFDGIEVPPVLPLYPYSVVVGSFSKNLSLAGERIGYFVPSPAMPGVEKLLAGTIMTNRILGFVNAPAIAQRLMASALGSEVDAEIYRERRDAMAEVLTNASIEFTIPKGAFYFFPKAPGGMDDKEFVDILTKHQILAVPGSGFGYPGFFRLALCTGVDVIKRSEPGFTKATAEAMSRG